MAVRALKQAYRFTCWSDDAVDRAVKHVQCFNPGIRAQTSRISDKFVHYFELASKVKNVDNIFPSMCCGSFHVISGIRNDLQDTCERISGSDTADYIVDLIITCFNDFIVMACRGLPSLTTCEKDEPAVSLYMKEGLQNPPIYRTTSILTSMMKSIDRLDKAKPPTEPSLRTRNLFGDGEARSSLLPPDLQRTRKILLTCRRKKKNSSEGRVTVTCRRKRQSSNRPVVKTDDV